MKFKITMCRSAIDPENKIAAFDKVLGGGHFQ